jgi:hypothetical protein
LDAWAFAFVIVEEHVEVHLLTVGFVHPVRVKQVGSFLELIEVDVVCGCVVVRCMSHTCYCGVAACFGTASVLGPGVVLYVRFDLLLFFGSVIGFFGRYGCGRIGSSQLLDTAHPGVWLVYSHGKVVHLPVSR